MSNYEEYEGYEEYEDLLQEDIEEANEVKFHIIDGEDLLSYPITYPITEEKEVGRYDIAPKGSKKTFIIYVYGREAGNRQHFHFYKVSKNQSPDPDKGGCMCIRTANYYIHDEHKATMNEDEIELLKKFLNEKKTNRENVPDHIITNWDYIIYLWNTNNSNYKTAILDLDTPIPDYYAKMETIQKGEKEIKKNE